MSGRERGAPLARKSLASLSAAVVVAPVGPGQKGYRYSGQLPPLASVELIRRRWLGRGAPPASSNNGCTDEKRTEHWILII